MFLLHNEGSRGFPDMITDIEKKEIGKELKEGFISFFHFSLSLIEDLSRENNNLKFAVVNMQTALELFLKYYFLMNDMPDRIFLIKNGKRKFKDFSVVLDSYYSLYRKSHYAEKKHLITILESRNDIVHKGKFKDWDEDLAKYIISCVFFIQGNLKNAFGETLLEPEYHPHKLSENWTWKEGSTIFANTVCKMFNMIPLECPFCFSRSLVSKEIFEFDDQGEIENYQCLTCLCDVDTQIYGAIIECCVCKMKSYYVDRLNVQPDKTHFGGCLNCGIKMDLRQCDNCDKFFFHNLMDEVVEFNNNYFCSLECLEMYKKSKYFDKKN